MLCWLQCGSAIIAVQLLSHAWLSGTSRTVACQAYFFTITGVCLNSYSLSQWFYTYIPSLTHLPPLPPYYSSRSPQCNRLSFLFTAASHQLSILQMTMYILQCYTPNSSHSFSIFELKWVLWEVSFRSLINSPYTQLSKPVALHFLFWASVWLSLCKTIGQTT